MILAIQKCISLQKGFICTPYNAWYAAEVEKDLQRSKSCRCQNFPKIGPYKRVACKMDTRAWLYEHMRKRPEIITKRFGAVAINKACVNTRAYVTRVNNPFRSEEYVVA